MIERTRKTVVLDGPGWTGQGSRTRGLRRQLAGGSLLSLAIGAISGVVGRILLGLP